MEALPPVSSVGEPESFNYQEYGGYYADDVWRSGRWSTIGRGPLMSTNTIPTAQ